MSVGEGFVRVFLGLSFGGWGRGFGVVFGPGQEEDEGAWGCLDQEGFVIGACFAQEGEPGFFAVVGVMLDVFGDVEVDFEVLLFGDGGGEFGDVGVGAQDLAGICIVVKGAAVDDDGGVLFHGFASFEDEAGFVVEAFGDEAQGFDGVESFLFAHEAGVHLAVYVEDMGLDLEAFGFAQEVEHVVGGFFGALDDLFDLLDDFFCGFSAISGGDPGFEQQVGGTFLQEGEEFTGEVFDGGWDVGDFVCLVELSDADDAEFLFEYLAHGVGRGGEELVWGRCHLLSYWRGLGTLRCGRFGLCFLFASIEGGGEQRDEERGCVV